MPATNRYFNLCESFCDDQVLFIVSPLKAKATHKLAALKDFSHTSNSL